MQPAGYSPYQQNQKTKFRSSRFKDPQKTFKLKKWLLIFLGVIFLIFFIFYLMLGELRFFANHYFGLGFFSKDYLVMMQNDSELRPTGGFLTAYGEVSMRFGLPAGIQFANSYDIDTQEYITPPYPQEDMLAGEWYQGYTFRDANWDPDFPNAAEDLIDFYQAKFPDKEVDGIIALNFKVIESLVDAFGGIELDGQTVTSQNLFSIITQSVNNVDRHNETALDGRKDVLGNLFNVIQGKMKRHPFKTKRVITESLNNKEMFLWLANERLQKKVVERNWGHTLNLPEGSDFLHVNIANLGGGKGNRYIQDEVHHYANISGNTIQGTVEIVVRYPGNVNNYLEQYNAYLRVYFHPLAEVDTGFLESEVIEENGFKVVGQKVNLEAGRKATFTFKYTLPADVFGEKGYQLYLAKQSGSRQWFDVVVEGAAGVQLVSPDMEVRENRAFFNDFLDRDQMIHVKIAPDTLAPYPTAQNFIDLDKIEIYWNEAMDEDTLNDPLNYSLTDMNYTDGEILDEIDVVYAEAFGDRRVEIEIQGASAQELERYALTLKNLRDVHGNSVDPNPKVVTVVQRLEENEE